MTLLVVLLVLVALGLLPAFGIGTDSRDRAYTLGAVLDHASETAAATAIMAAPATPAAPVAQWIEHPPSKRLVAGSIPAGGAPRRRRFPSR